MIASSVSNSSPARAGFITADFRAYLEQSLRNPFVLDLKDCSLMEVIRICAKAKSKIHPNYKESLGSLIYNLDKLEKAYRMTLMPVQITDIF